MKKNKIYFLLLFLLSPFCLADSPLTSITFWKVYQNENIVHKANASHNRLTKEIAEYLIKEDNPIDVKLAVINALGWNVKGQKNSQKFLKIVLKKFSLTKIEELERASDRNYQDIMLCYAYLKALDDYFDVTESLKITQKLQNFHKGTIYYEFIKSLLLTQHALLKNRAFCDVYKEAEYLINADKKNTFRKEVWEIYINYLNPYKKYCRNENM